MQRAVAGRRAKPPLRAEELGDRLLKRTDLRLVLTQPECHALLQQARDVLSRLLAPNRVLARRRHARGAATVEHKAGRSVRTWGERHQSASESAEKTHLYLH